MLSYNLLLCLRSPSKLEPKTSSQERTGKTSRTNLLHSFMPSLWKPLSLLSKKSTATKYQAPRCSSTWAINFPSLLMGLESKTSSLLFTSAQPINPCSPVLVSTKESRVISSMEPILCGLELEISHLFKISRKIKLWPFEIAKELSLQLELWAALLTS